ncbi:corazonin receptor-like [Tropilaelaps mercedesae]|uniref:Corazonin receptor-like n=1 Tax=Tropilaelaps mercedesae TaxID=418985 RepID=A0A1V9XEM6_9ACAR|nr:corazonin receptor-like [Tropilaelaps mercedesae]
MFIFRVLRGPFVEEFYQCVTYGFYSARWQEQLYTGVSFVTMFCVPLCFLVAIYADERMRTCHPTRAFRSIGNYNLALEGL